MELLETFQYLPEPSVPFPQADDFSKCILILDLLKEGIISEDYIIKNCGFVDRQSDYYVNACKYLGLIEKIGVGKYGLSELGKQLYLLSDTQRNLALIKLILSHQVFNEVFQIYYNKGEITKDEIVRIMKNCNLYNVDSESTYNRRASTISGRCDWILKTSVDEGFIFRIYCAQGVEGNENSVREASIEEKDKALKIAEKHGRGNDELLISILEAIISNGGKANYTETIYPYIKLYHNKMYNGYKSIAGVVNGLVQRHTKGLSRFTGEEIFINVGAGTYALKDDVTLF